MIITLCGSSKFKDKFIEVNKSLTLQGHIILMPAFFHHVEEDVKLPDEDMLRLRNLQKQKINMSDAIYVINVDKYIGKSTFEDVDWASKMEKKIYFLEPMDEQNPEDANKEDDD